MPLSYYGLLFLASALDVRPAGFFESRDSRNKLFETYAAREKAVGLAIGRLKGSLPASAKLVQFERDVDEVNKRMNRAKPDSADKELRAACQGLEDIKNQVTELERAWRHYAAALVHPQAKCAALQQRSGVQRETREIQAGIEEAVASAGRDEFEHACIQLTAVEAQCATAAQWANQYEMAVAQAKQALAAAASTMVAADIKTIEEMLDGADQKARDGDHRASLDLLEKVVPHCVTSRRANLKAGFNHEGNNYRQLLQPLADLKAHPQRGAFAQEIAELTARLNGMREAAAAGLKTQAPVGQVHDHALSYEARVLYWMAKKQLDFANQHGAFLEVRPRASDAIQQLRSGDPAAATAIGPDITALEALLKRADEQAARRHYDLALATLAEIVKNCTKAAALKQAHLDYVNRLPDLEPQVTGCRDVAGTPSAAEALSVRTLLAQAKAANVDRNYAGACALLDRLAHELAAVNRFAQAASQDEEDVKAVTTQLDEIPTAVAEAKRLLDALGRRDGHPGITTQLQDIDADIKAAEEVQDLRPEMATTRLTRAVETYLLAAQLADRHAAYVNRRDTEITPARTSLLPWEADPVVTILLVNLTNTLDSAQSHAAAQAYADASGELDSAVRQIESIGAFMAQVSGMRAELATLSLDAAGLTISAHRSRDPLIGVHLNVLDQQIESIRSSFTRAPVDLAVVERELRRARQGVEYCRACKLMKTPEASPEAVRHQLRALHQLPEGQRALDILAQQIDGPDRVLLVLAMRFNLKDGAIDQDEEDPVKRLRELKRLYAVMGRVPDKYTAKNPSLNKIVRLTRPPEELTTGEYTAYSGTITLTVGSVDTLDPDFLIDDSARPPAFRRREGVAQPKRFDIIVLHEVAHGIDDRLGFMKSRMGQDTFGGWQEYGGNIQAVTRVVAEVLGFEGIDANIIAKYVDSGIEPPATGDWTIVKAWADAARYTNDPWKQDDKCRQPVGEGGLNVEGRIYHEAYAGQWVSYLFNAREKRATNYQFRAPGEWFADIYAADKCNQLKDVHPAKVWLARL